MNARLQRYSIIDLRSSDNQLNYWPAVYHCKKHVPKLGSVWPSLRPVVAKKR
jgi:hypothetical protein